MTSIMTAERWLYSKLTGDSTLTGLVSTRIYNGTAPTSAAYPMVVYQALSGVDVNGVGAVFAMEDELFMVKAIIRSTSWGTAETIANRINALLHKAAGAVTGGTVISCVRLYVDKIDEIDNGARYKTIMQRYRIHTQ
jgi:hypothetical protein